jgi:uncharacterized membrane protein HdeD (DUF308 family)
MLTVTATASALARKVWRVGLLRGLAAVGLGAYVLSHPSISPAVFARAVAVYWILDGLVALWASLFAATLAMNRVFLVTRGAAGIVAALAIIGLPLVEVFGAWQPGQLLLLILTLVPALIAVGLQVVLAATIDLLIALEVRRQIPGDWSVLLGVAVSVVLGGLVVAVLIRPSAVLGHGLGVVGIAGGLGLVAGAFRLRSMHDWPDILPGVPRD